MKLFKFNKKAAAIGLAAGIALGAGGIAAAWFTSTGTGHGTGTVGTVTPTATKLTVTLTPSGNGPTTLFPTVLGDSNASFQKFKYTVHNPTESDIRLATVVITVTTGGASCTASWYAVAKGTSAPTVGATDTVTASPTVTLKPHTDGTTATYVGHFTLQLVESNSPQTACQGKHPKVTVVANAA